MSITIEIISQKAVTKTGKSNKPYQVLEIAYKNLSFQGKVEGRNIMAFGSTADTFSVLGTAQAGDVFDIDIIKNDAGFNDWVSAKKSVGGTTGSTSTAVSARPTAVQNATPVRSTYETPEERAKKQVFIVRQSSLSSAIDLLSVGAKSAPSVEQIIETAKQFEEFVFAEEKLAPRVDPDADPNDDIPF